MPVWHRSHQLARNVVHMIGIVVFVVSLIAIIGFVTNRPAMYNWNFPGAMSMPTAWCLLAVGYALWLLSRGEHGEE